MQLSTHAFGSSPTPQPLLRCLRGRDARSASAGSGSCGDGAGEGRGNWCAHSPPNTPCAAQAQPFPVFVNKGPSRAPPPPLAPPLPLTSRPAALVVSFSARAEATHVPLHAAQPRAARANGRQRKPHWIYKGSVGRQRRRWNSRFGCLKSACHATGVAHHQFARLPEATRKRYMLYNAKNGASGRRVN